MTPVTSLDAYKRVWVWEYSQTDQTFLIPEAEPSDLATQEDFLPKAYTASGIALGAVYLGQEPLDGMNRVTGRSRHRGVQSMAGDNPRKYFSNVAGLSKRSIPTTSSPMVQITPN